MNYRTIKITLFLVLLTTVLAVTSACFYSLDGKRVTGREGLKEVVYIYLEEKYGKDKDFSVIQTVGGGATGIGMRIVYLSSNEVYELLRVLEHEYRFRIGVVYNEEFSEEMRAPTNESVYYRSNMVSSIFVNSDLEHLN